MVNKVVMGDGDSEEVDVGWLAKVVGVCQPSTDHKAGYSGRVSTGHRCRVAVHRDRVKGDKDTRRPCASYSSTTRALRNMKLFTPVSFTPCLCMDMPDVTQAD